jgi:DNA mismatch endonuclease (patch repair protein)
MRRSRQRKARNPSFTGLNPASEAAARAKRANRKTDSRHEVLLRRELWKLGLRYRKYVANLAGNPDLVFRVARVIVFCDGDFWHGRRWKELKNQLRQRHNADYWIPKIARNRERDTRITQELTTSGWHVLRLWESDILRDVQAAGIIVRNVVLGRLSADASHASATGIAARKSLLSPMKSAGGGIE